MSSSTAAAVEPRSLRLAVGGATHARWVLPTCLQESPSGSRAAFRTCFHRFRLTSVKCNETPREVLAVSWLCVCWPREGSVNLEPAGSLLSCLSTKSSMTSEIALSYIFLLTTLTEIKALLWIINWPVSQNCLKDENSKNGQLCFSHHKQTNSFPFSVELESVQR